MKNTKYTKIVSVMILIVIFTTFLSLTVISVPVGPTISYIKNETSPNAGLPTNRTSDEGGYITTLNLNAVQQNYAWKAYVGNLTGTLVLENALNYSIYEWSINPNGEQEVYITRNSTIVWASVNCSNRTIITNEDSALSLNSSLSNSINGTFNTTTHKSFSVSGTTISNSTCPAISTYLNDAPQSVSESAKFQEVLLMDSSLSLIYASLISQNQAGFDGGLYDFQAIVAENELAATPSTYYFYVELG